MPRASSPSAHLTKAELEAQICELAGHLNAATYRFLLLIAEFDRREGWGHGDGVTRSCAHWLSWKLGIDLGAKELVEEAVALGFNRNSARQAMHWSVSRIALHTGLPAHELKLVMA